jgi:alkylation response protein AidB-like acyl-CoA dehydrogenase
LTDTEEQRELRTTVRRMLAEHWSPQTRRETLESDNPQDSGSHDQDGSHDRGSSHDRGGAYDPVSWKLMAETLGLQGISIPVEYGGSGQGFLEQSIVLEEQGRVLFRSPYLSTVVIAANALLLGDDEISRREWLPQISAGKAIAAMAYLESGGDWGAASPMARAVPADGGWRVSGMKSCVVDGAEADLFLVLASVEGVSAASGEERLPVLLAVDSRRGGIQAESVPGFDLTRRLATVTFDDAMGRAIAVGDRAGAVFESTMDIAVTGLACEQVGGAQWCLDATVEYVKTREQFGAPIGSFQAVQFKCADMLLELEGARSVARYAAASVGSPDLPVAASVAKAVCSDSYTAIAGEMIQLHGGTGYTWEHEAHLYFKRAQSSRQLFGDSDFHRERLAVRLGI